MGFPDTLTTSDGRIKPAAWSAFWHEALRFPQPATDESLAEWRQRVRAAVSMGLAVSVAVAVSANGLARTAMAARGNALAEIFNALRIKADATDDASVLAATIVGPLLGGGAQALLYQASVLYSDYIASTMPDVRASVLNAVADAWDYTSATMGDALEKAGKVATDIATAGAFGVGAVVAAVGAVWLLARSR